MLKLYKTKRFEVVSFLAGVILMGMGMVAPFANAYTSYPQGSLLQPNDVTSTHIRNYTIVDSDVSTTSTMWFGSLRIATSTTPGSVTIWTAGTAATSALQVSSNSTSSLFTVLDNGRVGISTSSPQYQFSVNGKIYSGTGGYVFPDGSTQTTAVIQSSTKVFAYAPATTTLTTTTTETTLVAVSLATSTMGTSNVIRVRMFVHPFNTTGGNVNFTYRLKYGTTTIQSMVRTVPLGTSEFAELTCTLNEANATNVQTAQCLYVGTSNTGVAVAAQDGTGVGAEDSVATKDIALTVQMATANAAVTHDTKNVVIEKIN